MQTVWHYFKLLGDQINHTDMQRCGFLCWRACPFCLCIVIWCAVTLWSGFHPGLTTDSITALLYAALGAGLLFLLLGFWGHRHPQPTCAAELTFYNHACIGLHMLMLVCLSFIVGPLNILTGIGFISIPLIDLLLFPLLRTLVYLGIGLLLLLCLSVLSLTGTITFQPVVHLGNAPTLYLAISNLLVAFFFLAYELTIVIAFIMAWRRRESTVLHLSVTDSLTNTINRRHILELLEIEIRDQRNADNWLSVIMVDIDHFKRINDTLGHQAGDKALQVICRTLHSCLRQSEQLGRYGGEEFLIILPDTSPERAVQIAERCRHAITTMQAGMSLDFPLTASFGVTSCIKRNIPYWDLMVRHADEALYKAKQSGRNQVARVEC